MKIHSLYLFLFLIIILHVPGNKLKAQGANTLTKKIIYNGYINFTGNKQSNLIGTLLYTDSCSYFYSQLMDSYQPINNDSLITLTPEKKALNNKVFKNFYRETLVFQGKGIFSGKEHYYTDSLNAMNWQIENESKTINSFMCQKAFTNWRGRSYTAWFCRDIPMPIGPWKYGGLPGLIIELYDSAKSVFWEIKEIRNTEELIPATPPAIGKYELYKKEINSEYKKLVQSLTANDTPSDPSCAGCKSSSSITIQTVENIVDHPKKKE